MSWWSGKADKVNPYPPPLGLLRGELRGNGEHVSTRQHKEKHATAQRKARQRIMSIALSYGQ